MAPGVPRPSGGNESSHSAICGRAVSPQHREASCRSAQLRAASAGALCARHVLKWGRKYHSAHGARDVQVCLRINKLRKRITHFLLGKIVLMIIFISNTNMLICVINNMLKQ